jgi:predicted metalloprotease with PDZ domain
MSLCFRTALLAFGLSLSALVASSVAGPPQKFLIAPGEPYGLPKFGFSSTTIQGFGERIESVRFGGRAERLGLERGDVILSINGYRLTYPGSWNDGLSRALYNNNVVRLKIRDVRSGNVYFRETFVDYGGGPVQHFKTTGNNFNDFPHDFDHHNGSPFKTFKDFKKLAD